jgi:hypothetical protein
MLSSPATGGAVRGREGKGTQNYPFALLAQNRAPLIFEHQPSGLFWVPFRPGATRQSPGITPYFEIGGGAKRQSAEPTTRNCLTVSKEPPRPLRLSSAASALKIFAPAQGFVSDRVMA